MNRSAASFSRLRGFIGARGVSTHGLSTYDMIGIASNLFGITPRPLDDMVAAIDALGRKGRRSKSKSNRKKMPSKIFSSKGAQKHGPRPTEQPEPAESPEQAMDREFREIIG